MSKKGHKKGLGLLADDNIQAEDLIQNAKEQQSSQKSMAFVANLDLQSEKPHGRLYTWMFIEGNKIKRYLSQKDLKHIPANEIYEEKALTKEDAKKLPADFKMPAIE